MLPARIELIEIKGYGRKTFGLRVDDVLATVFCVEVPLGEYVPLSVLNTPCVWTDVDGLFHVGCQTRPSTRSASRGLCWMPRCPYCGHPIEYRGLPDQCAWGNGMHA